MTLLRTLLIGQSNIRALHKIFRLKPRRIDVIRFAPIEEGNRNSMPRQSIIHNLTSKDEAVDVTPLSLFITFSCCTRSRDVFRCSDAQGGATVNQSHVILARDESIVDRF